jgi:hypothetical protein
MTTVMAMRPTTEAMQYVMGVQPQCEHFYRLLAVEPSFLLCVGGIHSLASTCFCAR